MPNPPVSPKAQELMRLAEQLLSDAAAESNALDRYAKAHLAALKAAAAYVAACPPVKTRRRRVLYSVWELLEQAESEFARWAVFFSAGASKRECAEAGLTGAVTPQEADDLVRDAGIFISLLEKALGLTLQTPLPTTSATD